MKCPKGQGDCQLYQRRSTVRRGGTLIWGRGEFPRRIPKTGNPGLGTVGALMGLPQRPEARYPIRIRLAYRGASAGLVFGLEDYGAGWPGRKNNHEIFGSSSRRNWIGDDHDAAFGSGPIARGRRQLDQEPQDNHPLFASTLLPSRRSPLKLGFLRLAFRSSRPSWRSVMG